MLKSVSRFLGAIKRACDEIPWQVVALTTVWILRDGLQTFARSGAEYEGQVNQYGSVTKVTIVKK